MTRRRIGILVLLVGFTVLLFNGGSRFTMGLMLRPMAEDLGWGRSTLSLTVTGFMIVSALALPLSGRLVDRYNTFFMLACSMALGGVAIALMRFIDSPTEALLLYGVLFALASAGTSITPIGVIVSRYFPSRIGIANSIAISGMGIGQLLIILLLTRQLGIMYGKTPGDNADNYLVDHSASIILFNPDGNFLALFGIPHDPGLIAQEFIAIKNYYEATR